MLNVLVIFSYYPTVEVTIYPEKNPISDALILKYLADTITSRDQLSELTTNRTPTAILKKKKKVFISFFSYSL